MVCLVFVENKKNGNKVISNNNNNNIPKKERDEIDTEIIKIKIKTTDTRSYVARKESR